MFWLINNGYSIFLYYIVEKYSNIANNIAGVIGEIYR